MELSTEIRTVSKLAEEAVKDDTLYMIGGKWESASRVARTEREGLVVTMKIDDVRRVHQPPESTIAHARSRRKNCWAVVHYL